MAFPLLYLESQNSSSKVYGFKLSEHVALYSEHKVNGTPIFPAAGFLDLVAQGVFKDQQSWPVSLAQITLVNPLEIISGKQQTIFISTKYEASNKGEFEVYTLDSVGTNVRHVFGKIGGSSSPLSAITNFNVDAEKPIADHYKELLALGLDYGPKFQRLRSLQKSTICSMGEIESDLDVHANAYVVHPTMLDSAFHLAFALIESDPTRGPQIPFSIDQVRWYGPIGTKGIAYLQRDPNFLKVKEVSICNLDIVNKQNEVGIQIRGLSLRPKPKAPQISINNSKQKTETQDGENMKSQLYVEQWKETPLTNTQATTPNHLFWVGEASDAGVNLFLTNSVAVTCLKKAQPAQYYRDAITSSPTKPADGIFQLFLNLNATNDELALNGLNGYLSEIGQTVLGIAQATANISVSQKVNLTVFVENHKLSSSPDALTSFKRSIAGMLRTILLEVPNFNYRFIESVKPFAGNSVNLLKEITSNSNGDEVCYKDGRRFQRVIAHTDSTHWRSVDRYSAEKWHVVTGGAGKLGIKLVEHLHKHGAKKFVLLGRRAPDAHAQSTLQALTTQGAQVRFASCDVASRDSVVSALHEFHGKIGGVFHLAGVLADAPLFTQTWEHFKTTYPPKVLGAWNLHDVTKSEAIEHFVLFSSQTSFIGNPGQANYALGNSFLDKLATERREHGLPATAINWGPWSDVGMAATPEIIARMAARGVGLVSLQEGFQFMNLALGSNEAGVAVLNIDWEKFAKSTNRTPSWHPHGSHSTAPVVASVVAPMVTPVAPTAPVAPILVAPSSMAVVAPMTQPSTATPVATTNPVAPASTETIELPAKFASLPQGRLRSSLEEHIRSDIATIMGFASADKVSVEAPLMEIGLDSLMTVELRNRLAAEFKVDLQPSFIFKFPTITAIAGYLVELHETGGSPAVQESPKTQQQVATPSPVAIPVAPVYSSPAPVAPAVAPTAPVAPMPVQTSSGAANVEAMSDDEIRAYFLQKSRVS